MMLVAPAQAGPRRRDPFVIVDQNLTVQAVSRQAEMVLSVDEPAGVNIPLDEFLIPAKGEAELARLVALAIGRRQPSERLELYKVGDPALRFFARVSSCGPPPAALLVLSGAHDRGGLVGNRSRGAGALRTLSSGGVGSGAA
jgi:hypothetical protein